MKQTLAEIRDLTKPYVSGGGFLNLQKRTIRAVDHLHLTIFQGETLGLVGESGCGKSTLARLLMRLEMPSSGAIRFQGDDIYAYDRETLQKYRRHVQMIFQDTYSSLNPRMSALSIIREPLTIHKIGNRTERVGKALEIMAKVGLNPGQATRYPHEFSGGQRQRIGIARALILQPELIIADEPVSSLDVSIQAQILNLLLDLKKDFHLTYLFISHDLNVIRFMAQRIAVMYLGRIVELAGNRDIYNQPLHPYTRMLLSAVPRCDPHRKRRKTEIKGEAVSDLDSGCAFYNRCSYKKEICLREIPALEQYGENRFCACHFTGRI